jgi:hypothetical protein
MQITDSCVDPSYVNIIKEYSVNIRISYLALLLTILFSIDAFALPADAVPSMAALDKKYISALGLSGQAGNLEPAKIAFSDFEVAWNAFNLRYSNEPGFDAEWKDDLSKVGEAVSKAKVALVGEANGPAAHEALEAVRMTLLASRTRQKIPYFLDYLTLYHNDMEALLAGKPQKALKDWSDTERKSFAADLDIAAARWEKVKSQEGLLPAAALSTKASAAYAARWQEVDSIMAGTKRAFESGDEKAFSDTLGQLKPAFIKTFFLFGEFPQ